MNWRQLTGRSVTGQYYSEESLLSLCGITVGDSRHTAVRGEEEIKRQCQEQPPLIKNAPSQAARSYIHTLSLMHGNVFTLLNLTSAHVFCHVLYS